MRALCGEHGALRERNGVVWRVGANVERERAVAAAVAKERATAAKTVADLEQRLDLAGERATLAERKLASAVARERRASRAIANLARTFPHHAPALGHDGEPTFLD